MNTPAIAESVTVFMEHAMSVNPSNVSWLRTQGDLYYGMVNSLLGNI